jgi:thioredoxin-related protein
MKSFAFIVFISISFFGFSREYTDCSFDIFDDKSDAIIWYDFETAIEKNSKARKPIFIDIYTSWCGWCKKMDNSTFKEPSVVEYMNENYYAVKMDAESEDPIAFKEVLYEYKIYNGKTGYNELAVSLMGGKMSFPTFVVLSKRQVKVGKISGFQKPTELMMQLKKYAKK